MFFRNLKNKNNKNKTRKSEKKKKNKKKIRSREGNSTYIDKSELITIDTIDRKEEIEIEGKIIYPY